MQGLYTGFKRTDGFIPGFVQIVYGFNYLIQRGKNTFSFFFIKGEKNMFVVLTFAGRLVKAILILNHGNFSNPN